MPEGVRLGLDGGAVSQQEAIKTAEAAEAMENASEEMTEESLSVLPATEGTGPLFQRDYWMVLEGTRLDPPGLIKKVMEEFPRLSPEGLASFCFKEGTACPVGLETILDINILAAGACQVQMVRIEAQSFTMRTLEGHPEAGRITMGAYWDEHGRLVFRIRSRARASDPLRYVGFQFFGKELQTRIWFGFMKRLAEACGGWIQGDLHEETVEATDTLADEAGLDTPTFVASDKEP